MPYKTKKASVNDAGYVKVKKTDLLAQVDGKNVDTLQTQYVATVKVKKISTIGELQGKSFYNSADDHYYVYVGDSVSKADVNYNVKPRTRKVTINKCGYAKISPTKSYSLAKLLKVNGVTINANAYAQKGGECSCRSKKGDYSIGDSQGQSFVNDGSLYLYYGKGYAGTKIEVLYEGNS
jgi:hypothetical protein